MQHFVRPSNRRGRPVSTFCGVFAPHISKPNSRDPRLGWAHGLAAPWVEQGIFYPKVAEPCDLCAALECAFREGVAKAVERPLFLRRPKTRIPAAIIAG